MKTLLTAIILVVTFTLAHAQDRQRQPQKWEYATFQVSPHGGFHWTCGKTDLESKDDSELHTRLAAAGALGKPDPTVPSYPGLWQAIGERGWELVAVEVYPEYSNRIYIFKRPKA
jgi:hypothetical protein